MKCSSSEGREAPPPWHVNRSGHSRIPGNAQAQQVSPVLEGGPLVSLAPFSLVLALLVLGLESDRAGALESLVRAERAVSRNSVEHALRDAFLAFLADDGILFQPLPVSGKRALEARTLVAGAPSWEPEYAEVSAACDFGFTTGPWELRSADHRSIQGQFVSAWRRWPGSEWRVVLHIVCTLEPSARRIGVTTGPAPSGLGSWPGRRRLPELELAAAERELERDARKKGLALAPDGWVTPDLRFYREGEMPRVGPEARAALAGDFTATGRSPRGRWAARSGDLGCTYGVLERPRPGGVVPDSAVYVRIWRRGTDGRWRIALAVHNPLPKSR